jgi:LVIVD repeat
MGKALARGRGISKALLAAAILALLVAAPASAQLPTTDDPRANLAPGFESPGTAELGVDHLANRPKPPGFFSPGSPGSFAFLTSDMAFQGDHAFVGGFNGFQAWNIANPSTPTLTTAVVCPGGQGDLSAFGDLLFMSVEESRARVDCGTDPAVGTRFQGVRIFDISDVANPVQVAAVQTCRGSHTHTLVDDESDPNNVYIYVQGTAGVRPAATLAGCNNNPANGENPSRWRIEVIRVPLAAPENAAVVSEPRLFTNPANGAVDGLQNTLPTPLHPSGIPWSPQPITDACHDITVYEEIDLAAGACEGNGLLIDISDPADPRRIDAVADPLWAYWHGATFSNDGRYVIFTDEWGGGTAPRCRATDHRPWGGDAIYEIVGGELEFRSYYKLPVAQTNQENCVTHIPSLVPVPGRDLFIQAFYQGGASLVDFEDAENPREIGYFDRGPVSGTTLVFGGFWSTYWYNGVTYGSELARNFDVMGLTPTSQISANEIAAAREVQWDRLNVQSQQRITWDPSFNVVRSYRDQLVREGNIDARTLQQVDKFVDRAEEFNDRGDTSSASDQLHAIAQQLRRNPDFAELRRGLQDLSDAL